MVSSWRRHQRESRWDVVGGRASRTLGAPEGQRPDQQPGWHPRFGDRAQQLVFIGQQMHEAAMRARLDACLLDEHLAAANSKTWAGFRNPFPELIMAEDPA